MKINTELDTRFRTTQILLTLGGIPLLDTVTPKYNLYRVLMSIIIFMIVLGTLLHSIANRENVEVASNSLRVLFMMTEGIWMMTCFR
jgi:hypothetical protein